MNAKPSFHRSASAVKSGQLEELHKATSNPRKQPASETAGLSSLLSQLRTGDFQARWDAAKAVPQFGEAAIAPLLELLQDEDEELNWFAARILAHFNHPSVIPALIALLQTTEEPEIMAVVAGGLANFGVAAIPPLQQLLAHPETRSIAVQSLAQIRTPLVLQPLLSVVADPDPAIRSSAIEALSHIYDAAVVTALKTALHDSVASVRRAAAIALGIQAKQLTTAAELSSWVEALKPLLWDLDLTVCRQAALALGRIGSPAIPILAQVLASAHTPIELQLEIVRALVWIDSPQALQPLQQLTSLQSATDSGNHNRLTQEIVAILGRIESEQSRSIAVELLLQLLQTSHPVTQTTAGKQQIALSLGQLQDSRAIDTLIELLADPAQTIQLHAIAALKQFTPSEVRSRLQTIAADPTVSPTLKSGVMLALPVWAERQGD